MPSSSAPYGVPAQGEEGIDSSPAPSPGIGGDTEGGVSSSMPPTSAPSVCEAAHPDWLGDGWCDGSSEYNSAACGYDHGDCCPLTCLPGRPFACGSNGFVCWDPQQTHVNASLLSMRFLVANASAGASADRLQGMVALAISPYLTGSGALDIRSLSVQVTAGVLPAVTPALRPLSLSLRHHHMVTAAAAVSSNYTVSAQMVYSAFPNASAAVAFLAASVSSGDMQKVLRMLASDMDARQFIGVLVCSEANTTACTTQEVQPSDDDAHTSSSSTSSCSRDSSGWVRWYGSPVSVVWQWAMLACWSAALPVPLIMMMKTKTKADRATSLAQCAAVLARMLYHIFVLMEAMQTPSGYDDMACIELSFADADWDPAFTMLQSLFYLSLLCAAALDTGSRRRAWRPWLGIVQVIVLGLLVWQCQVVIARHDAVMGQLVRIAAQCFSGVVLLLLALAALGGWQRCCSMLLAGVLTVVTAVPAVLAFPAATFLLYTVLARLGEIACLCCLQMGKDQGPIRSTKRHRLRAAVEEKEEEQAEAEGVEPEEGREGSRAGGGAMRGQSRTAAVPVHDRVFPEPRLPSWISRWTYAYAYSRASYQSVQESNQDQGQGHGQGHSLRSIVAAQRGLG